MKLLSVRDLRNRSAQVWKTLAAEREMVLTSNGRPIAVLSTVTEDTLEETLTAIRRARALAAVSGIQRHSVERGADGMGRDEIDAEIAAVRRHRRRRQARSE